MTRAHIRERRCLPVTIVLAGKRATGVIEDASAQGLRLRVPLAVEVDAIVTLQGLGAVVQAQVRWCAKDQIGVALLGDPKSNDLRRFLNRVLNAPLPGRGARMHGFREMGPGVSGSIETGLRKMPG